MAEISCLTRMSCQARNSWLGIYKQADNSTGVISGLARLTGLTAC